MSPIPKTLKTYKTGKMALHHLQVIPKYRDLFPPQDKGTLARMREGIERDGVTSPLVINDRDELLDGYTRRRLLMDIYGQVWHPHVPVVIRPFDSAREELGFVTRFNIHRRHLTAEQRHEIAKKVYALLKPEAQPGKGGGKGGGPFLGQIGPTKEEAYEVAAQASGLSTSSVKKMHLGKKSKPVYRKVYEAARAMVARAEELRKLEKSWDEMYKSDREELAKTFPLALMVAKRFSDHLSKKK